MGLKPKKILLPESDIRQRPDKLGTVSEYQIGENRYFRLNIMF